MGKIKVAALGSENEDALREKERVKREEKKKREKAGKKSEKTRIAGMKGGERLKVAGALSDEETEKFAKLAEEVEKDQAEGVKTEEKKEPKKKKVHKRSKRYQEVIMKLDKDRVYPISEALPLLRAVSLTRFDATVELHINVAEKGLKGKVTLPHGTGKEIKVAIADADTIDKLIKEVETGKIDFDALIAHPSVMPKLAKIARYLGPKGLMPNPKAGTISPTPEKVAEKLKGGELNWKTEAEFPIIHQRVGILSFKDKQLEENISSFIKSVGETKIKNITLKSTMSPGIKIQFA